MKKVIRVAALVVALLMVTAVPIMAATEEEVIAALEAAGVPANYVDAAESYLNGAGLNAATLDTVVAQVNAADATAGGTSAENLSDAQRAAILANMQAAASAAGLTVSVNGSTVAVVDGSGITIISASVGGGNTGSIIATTVTDGANPIKVTGQTPNFSGIAVVGVGLALLFGTAVALGGTKRKTPNA